MSLVIYAWTSDILFRVITLQPYEKLLYAVYVALYRYQEQKRIGDEEGKGGK